MRMVSCLTASLKSADLLQIRMNLVSCPVKTPAAWWAGALDVALGYRMTLKGHSRALSKTAILKLPLSMLILVPRKVQVPLLFVVSFHSSP